MKYIIAALFLASGLLFSYPMLDEAVQDAKQKQLLEQFANQFQRTATEQQLSQQALELVESKLLSDESNLQSEEVEEQGVRILDESSRELLEGGAIGIISIEKIDLLLPILAGATEENMKYAATHITETTPIGEVGNAGIAAHRARTKGRLFHDLDEVEIGDKIVIHTLDKDLSYTVFNTRRVFPVQVSVLNRNNVDEIITLITCDPVVDSTHRIIVQAKLDQ